MSAEEDAPRKLLSRAYWAAMAVAALCMAASVVVALWGPRLFPPGPAPAPALARAPARAMESPPDPSGPP